MTSGKRPPVRATTRHPLGELRAVEFPPLAAGTQVAGVGQGLFHAFRDELMRWHARRASTTPASEVNHG